MSVSVSVLYAREEVGPIMYDISPSRALAEPYRGVVRVFLVISIAQFRFTSGRRTRPLRRVQQRAHNRFCDTKPDDGWSGPRCVCRADIIYLSNGRARFVASLRCVTVTAVSISSACFSSCPAVAADVRIRMSTPATGQHPIERIRTCELGPD